VPDDVSVVGFNDDPATQFFRPALTTVSIDFFEVGRACAREVVTSVIGESRAETALPPPTLVVRASTAPPSIRSSPA
jgi:LacI family transcriptional regulator